MSWDSEINRQDAIETACLAAFGAMSHVVDSAPLQQRPIDQRLVFAAALEQILRAIDNQTAAELPFTLQDCIDHLRRTAAPRRGVQS